jgi:prolyl-tRNA editing enzyme YbaK/EbsC (Cys-tRNA(Pro) deacylase)
MKTIVDSSLAQDEGIVFAANKHHEAIRMRFQEYRELEVPKIGQFALDA